MKTPREILLNRHRSVEPKLDRLWDESHAPELPSGRARTREASTDRPNLFLAVGGKLWRELILPSRRIWAGLACAWAVIAVINLASAEPATGVVSQAEPRSGEEIRILIEQRRMLAQMIEPAPSPVDKRKSISPGPRSDRPVEVSTA
ncbi:MAG: hypothetical protein ABSA12_05255 [Verrucomicrobiia bacterium]|jgi:hypothetical protein